MILPETKATKTANTMNSTAISFFGRWIEWVDKDNCKEINIIITDKTPEEIE